MSEQDDSQADVDKTDSRSPPTRQAGTFLTSRIPYERFIWENRQKFGALSWSGLLRYGRGIVSHGRADLAE